MKTFLKKIGVFLLLMLIIYLAFFAFDFFVMGSQYQQSYDAAAIDKAERLMSLNEAKIVLVGNSNVAYGFDSRLIEEEMGLPVVNMGLDRFLGNAFNERLALLNIHEGDIVVIAHSSFSDEGKAPNGLLLWYTIEMHPKLWRAVGVRDIPALAAAYPQYFFNAFCLWIKGEGNLDDGSMHHSRSAFNSYGDIASRPPLEYPFRFFEGSVEMPEINDTCIKRLNRLNAKLRERGAHMVVAACPIADGEFSPARAEVERFADELECRLDCPIISDYADYFYPYELFYDSALHMTAEGAKLRSEMLVGELKEW